MATPNAAAQVRNIHVSYEAVISGAISRLTDLRLHSRIVIVLDREGGEVLDVRYELPAGLQQLHDLYEADLARLAAARDAECKKVFDLYK
jgi:hypothetical protein